ncbi:ATP-binding cassette domain-containing protein [Dyella sp. 20L07]|uniref:ATP-binding cassette domain-containing protein n=1 Tax=Dyella sp. 20L07 TaxID=3384240 RepID=UPI003D29D1E1
MTAIAILAHQLGFAPSTREPVFDELNLALSISRHALVGRNGSGKSLLGRILANQLTPTSGAVIRHVDVGYLPQQLNLSTGSIADALGIGGKLAALRRIEAGSTDPGDFQTLADDWSIDARCRRWLIDAGLPDELARPWRSLSGGERVRLQLSQLFEQVRSFLILDEPGNHLDRRGRAWLQDRLRAHPGGSLLISHDRELLADVDSIDELSSLGLRRYGGGYEAYSTQRHIEAEAAQRQLEQARREQQALVRNQREEQQRLSQKQNKAKRERANANLPTILLDRRKQRSEMTQQRLSTAQRIQRAQHHEQLTDARTRVEEQQAQRFDLGTFTATGTALWLEGVVAPYGHAQPIDLYLAPGERLHLSGDNGSGKSSLLAAITGRLSPRAGHVRRGERVFLIDQHYSLLHDHENALENLRRLSPGHSLTDYRHYLAGIGLRGDRAELAAGALSGGERVKLALLALDSAQQPYDLLLLDEPDCHLDLDSRQLLEKALASYRGTLVLISHDPHFVALAGVDQELRLG